MPAATAWYADALGATVLWDLGSLAGLDGHIWLVGDRSPLNAY